MSAVDPVVVRLPRVDGGDDEPDFILLHVSPKLSNPLDLQLIGTDNNLLFAVSLNHNQTSKLKSKKVNQEEWNEILLSVLLGTDSEGTAVAVPDGVEAVAKVDGETSMTITFQRNIEGITQKLGSIILPGDEEAAGDLYLWCGLSLQGNRKLSQELQVSKTKLNEKDAQIKKLEDSLAELAKLKTDNETQLLEKFSLLLNEKKLKIRDQQRLLQSSNVDPAAAQVLEETRLAVRSRSVGASRRGKRKAGQIVEEQSSDDGFEKMDVDNQAEHDSDQEQQQTPDASTEDEGTASEASADDEPVPPPKRKVANTRQAGSSQTIRSKSRSESPGPQKQQPSQAKKIATSIKAPAPVDDGSETESDDEL